MIRDLFGENVLLNVKPQHVFGESANPAAGDVGAIPPNSTLQIELELVSWKTVTEVTDDTRVLKKTLKEGEGYERPNDGSVVQLRLIGKLENGTVFVKEGHDEAEGLFEFKTGNGQVIDGLDMAVMEMKKGEVALVIIAPEYAFGSTATQLELAEVPRYSTVLYEVELVSFEKEIQGEGYKPVVLNIGEEREIGKQGLKKKLLKEGEGRDTPQKGDQVQVHYSGTFLEYKQFDSCLWDPYKIMLGEGSLGADIEGWDLGMKTMRKGERASFTIPPELAYGEEGSLPDIPPNATLMLDVELLDVFTASQRRAIQKELDKFGDSSLPLLFPETNPEDDCLQAFSEIHTLQEHIEKFEDIDACFAQLQRLVVHMLRRKLKFYYAANVDHLNVISEHFGYAVPVKFASVLENEERYMLERAREIGLKVCAGG